MIFNLYGQTVQLYIQGPLSHRNPHAYAIDYTILKGCPEFNNFHVFDTIFICVKIVIFFVLFDFFISTTTTFFNLFYFSDLFSLCFSFFSL